MFLWCPAHEADFKNGCQQFEPLKEKLNHEELKKKQEKS